jgi:hypothetical protein
MRKYLLATAAVVALTGPAHALVPVTDAKQIIQNVEMLAQWAQQIAAMKQQYDQLVMTYNALAHATDLSGVAAALGGVTRTYLPEATIIPDMLGTAGYLWGRGAYFNEQDAYYAIESADRWTKEMERRRSVTSNAKALAAASSLDAQDHVMKLGVLQARLQAAQDVTEVTAVNGLIALEQQNLDSHRAQVENIRLMMMADDRVSEQRAEQMQRESADRLMAATAPITDDLR